MKKYFVSYLLNYMISFGLTEPPNEMRLTWLPGSILGAIQTFCKLRPLRTSVRRRRHQHAFTLTRNANR